MLTFWQVARLHGMGLFRGRSVASPKRLTRVGIPDRQEILGESLFQSEIAAFKAIHGRKVVAVLRVDEGHPQAYGPVRVDLAGGPDTVIAGWLPEADGHAWLPVIERADSDGFWLYCDAEIRGGWESAPAYGVWLVPERS